MSVTTWLYGFKVAILIATGFEQSEMVGPQKALESAELPTIRDFGKDGMNKPHWKFGLTMLKAGLKIIDQNNFKFTFKSLQEQVFHTVMNV